jgi:hypothetical protein
MTDFEAFRPSGDSDHYVGMSQIELFAPPAPSKPKMPTAETVRPKLEEVLDQLRNGMASNWSPAERRRWQAVFPQMCDWLPEGEREDKRAEFNRLLNLGLSRGETKTDIGHRVS